MTYALLIYRTSDKPVTEAQVERALDGHRAVQDEAASRGQLHAVARLGDRTASKVVRLHDGAHSVTDGPFVETKEWLVGFYLVDCDDEAEAISRARTIAPGHEYVIEIRPVTWRYQA